MTRERSTPRESGKQGRGANRAACMASPVPLEHFPGIPYEYTEVLKSKGIASSACFLQMTRSDKQCTSLAGSTGIPENRIREILALCDLARIRGMGPKVARGFYQAGIRSVRQLAGADIRSMCTRLHNVSGAGSGANPAPGLREMEEFIRCAGIIAAIDRKEQS